MQKGTSMSKLVDYGRCPMCGEIFERTREDRMYCSTKCRQAAFRERKPGYGQQQGQGNTSARQLPLWEAAESSD
jgi:hypothetical protein